MSGAAPKPGQWFDTGTMYTNGRTGWPKLCTSVSGSRVYFRRWNKSAEYQAEIDAQPPEYCSLSSVGYVTDSKAEMIERIDLGRVHMARIEAALKAVNEQFDVEAAALRQKHAGGAT